VRIVVVGIGGYGESYLREALRYHRKEGIVLAGAVDPVPERCGRLAKISRHGVPVFDDLDAFYRSQSADLAVIASPHHYHADQACLALSRGANVLCEKPLAATIQDARRMTAASRETGKFVAIGYQWSFSDAIQQLKADIQAGLLGAPVQLKTVVFWPRRRSYYDRNSWAGSVKTAAGQWVLDSPANNANAHFLHNMFFVLGSSAQASARPVDVQAELCRANDIANYDTAAIRCRTDIGAEVLFYTTHAITKESGPTFGYEFEKASVSYDGEGTEIVAHFHDGRTKVYGDPQADHMRKFHAAIEAARTGSPVACTAESAMSQTLCINGAQESAEIIEFPDDLRQTDRIDDDSLTWVEGLRETFEGCWQQGALPSELGDVSWARAGRVVHLRSYESFPQSAI
jgi:predicted dehydrogenase